MLVPAHTGIRILPYPFIYRITLKNFLFFDPSHIKTKHINYKMIKKISQIHSFSLTRRKANEEKDIQYFPFFIFTGGQAHTVLLKPDGTIWAWGFNVQGQLEIGTIIHKNRPYWVANHDMSDFNGN